MRLTRKAVKQNTKHEPRILANKKEFYGPGVDWSWFCSEKIALSFDGKEFSLCILGKDGIESSENKKHDYKYEIILTLKEVRLLLSRSLQHYHRTDFPGSREISADERKLWNTLFDQWEKRIRALARRGKKNREADKTLN